MESSRAGPDLIPFDEDDESADRFLRATGLPRLRHYAALLRKHQVESQPWAATQSVDILIRENADGTLWSTFHCL